MQAKTSAEAHKMKLKAQKRRQVVQDLPNRNMAVSLLDLARADDLDAAANALLVLPNPPERGTGGELMPPSDLLLTGMEEAVKNPSHVTLQASIERVGLADRVGAFNLAFDAAESVGAQNATEQMLTHQMAAAHKMALDMLAKSAEQTNTVEMSRLANTAARLMDAYQKGMLTLHRVRTGGKQVVTVQHIQVADGGQAVVAGAMNTGGHLAGGNQRK